MNSHDIAISVGICTLARPESLLRTIEEVRKQNHASVAEILVLDQTPEADIPEDASTELQRLQDQGVIQYVHRETPGLTAARNHALSLAKTELVLFIDDDVLLPPGYIEAHLKVFRECPKVIGVAGPVYHSKGKVPLSELSVENPSHGTGEHFTGRNPGCFVEEWPEIMVGCNHSIRKEAAIAVGGYDEGIVGGYYEDSEMTSRLRKSGLGSIAFSPDCWLVHLRVPSGGCRIVKNAAHSEADKVSGFILFAFRHLNGKARWRLLWQSLRVGPLRRENVVTPSHWYSAWCGYVKALARGWTCRHAVKSPFVTNNA